MTALTVPTQLVNFIVLGWWDASTGIVQIQDGTTNSVSVATVVVGSDGQISLDQPFQTIPGQEVDSGDLVYGHVVLCTLPLTDLVCVLVSHAIFHPDSGGTPHELDVVYLNQMTRTSVGGAFTLGPAYLLNSTDYIPSESMVVAPGYVPIMALPLDSGYSFLTYTPTNDSDTYLVPVFADNICNGEVPVSLSGDTFTVGSQVSRPSKLVGSPAGTPATVPCLDAALEVTELDHTDTQIAFCIASGSGVPNFVDTAATTIGWLADLGGNLVLEKCARGGSKVAGTPFASPASGGTVQTQVLAYALNETAVPIVLMEYETDSGVTKVYGAMADFTTMTLSGEWTVLITYGGAS